MGRWQNSEDDTNIQQFTTSNSTIAGRAYSLGSQLGDNVISDASFVRLKNLPTGLIQRAKIQNMRIYFQAQNLLTMTNYLGLDPESQSDFLPPLRMLTMGLQITF